MTETTATVETVPDTDAALISRVAAAICNARVDANLDACGGGSIGYHAIGEPGGCSECQKEAREVVNG
jgi:hypothetical protein